MRLALLALVLSTTSVAAQPWDYDVALDSAYALDRADDPRAIDWYEIAFSRALPENQFTAFSAAESAMRMGRSRQAIAFLHLAAKSEFSSFLYAHRVDSLEPLRVNAAVWNEWIDAIHRAQARLHPGYDESFARDVIRLALEGDRAADRRYDLEGDSTISSAERENRLGVLEAVEHAVESEVAALLEERGWPRASEVGWGGAQIIYELVGRLSPTVRERFLSDFRAALEDGEADTDNYARFADQARADAGRPQLYGTAFWYDENAGESVQYPVEDGVDERRAEIGMMSLEEWFSRMSSHDWPPRTGWPPE